MDIIRESIGHFTDNRKDKLFTNIKEDPNITEDNIEEELEVDIPEDTTPDEAGSSSSEERKLAVFRSNQGKSGRKPRAVSAVFDLSHPKKQ